MADENVSKEELERQQAETLPDREVMSTVNPSISPEPIVPLDEGPFPTDPISPK
jgi:hypothetical protein